MSEDLGLLAAVAGGSLVNKKVEESRVVVAPRRIEATTVVATNQEQVEHAKDKMREILDLGVATLRLAHEMSVTCEDVDVLTTVPGLMREARGTAESLAALCATPKGDKPPSGDTPPVDKPSTGINIADSDVFIGSPAEVQRMLDAKKSDPIDVTPDD